MHSTEVKKQEFGGKACHFLDYFVVRYITLTGKSRTPPIL